MVEFYPSISKEILENAISFANKHRKISEEDRAIIFQARESFLFINKEPWIKRGNQGRFDVPMGSYDGAEVCELVGLYMLDKLTGANGPFKKDEIGIYRDDGLAAIQGSGTRVNSLSKEVTALFKKEKLRITVDVNITTTDYLDVMFNLKTDSYRPYRKPNDWPVFMHMESSHPPGTKDQMAKNTYSRISMLSSDETIFNEEIGIYQDALVNSGYTAKPSYQPPKDKQSGRIRRRNILWFNPPFSANVKTNVAAIFLKMVDKHFPVGSNLRRYFNRSTIKVSYSTTKNMKAHVAKHNRQVLNPIPEEMASSGCNCQDKKACPMNGNCEQKSIVYQADVSNSKGQTMTYYGLTGDTFKKRYYNHTSSFRHEKYKGSTTLSKYIWKLKSEGTPASIKWSIKASAFGYTCGAKYCDLCLVEKTTIALADPITTLNRRSEIMSKCRHKNKFLLKNY